MSASTSSEGYAWGAPDDSGVALGLKVDRSVPGACEYRIALANHAPEPRAVVLFAALDDRIRTRIVARQGDAEAQRPAVLPGAAIASNVRMIVELAPGQVLERAGTPADFDLVGEATVQLVMGGVKAQPTELRSGEVFVSLTPAS